MKKLVKISIVLIMTALIALSAVGCSIFINKNGSIDDLPHSSETMSNVVINEGGGARQKLDRLDAIKKVQRSCVAIRVPVGTSSSSYGSGTIINITRQDNKGNNIDSENVFYVMTCHHVVDYKGSEIYVYIPDREGDNYGESDYNQDFILKGKIGGGKFDGQVSLIGGDLKSDVAILKLDISGTNITKEDIVKSDIAPASYQMQVGEDVFAIGNPSGQLPGTVSVGTISYINRETSIDSIGEMTLLQINTDIFHGSSGGALYNLYGEVIGLTNAGSDTYVGICYAIPFVIDADNGTKDNGFVNIISQLLGSYTGDNYGYISGRRDTFGFTVVPIEDSEYIKITAVTEGSQAQLKGLKVDDIILNVQVNGGSKIDIKKNADLTEVIEGLVSGDKLTLNVSRKKNYFENEVVAVTLTVKQFIFCDTGVYPQVEEPVA